jgi:hypothetical protein
MNGRGADRDPREVDVDEFTPGALICHASFGFGLEWNVDKSEHFWPTSLGNLYGSHDAIVDRVYGKLNSDQDILDLRSQVSK